MPIRQRLTDKIAKLFSEQFGEKAPTLPFLWCFLSSLLGCTVFNVAAILLNAEFLSGLVVEEFVKYLKVAPVVAGAVILTWSTIWALILVHAFRKGNYYRHVAVGVMGAGLFWIAIERFVPGG